MVGMSRMSGMTGYIETRGEKKRKPGGGGNREIFESLLLQRSLTNVARRFIVGHKYFSPPCLRSTPYELSPMPSNNNKK